jgi:hypothetical protein
MITVQYYFLYSKYKIVVKFPRLPENLSLHMDNRSVMIVIKQAWLKYAAPLSLDKKAVSLIFHFLLQYTDASTN